MLQVRFTAHRVKRDLIVSRGNNSSRAHAQTGGCTELKSCRLRDYLKKNIQTQIKCRQRCFKRGFDLVVKLWPEMKRKTLTQPPLCRQIMTAAKATKKKRFREMLTRLQKETNMYSCETPVTVSCFEKYCWPRQCHVQMRGCFIFSSIERLFFS